MVELNHRQRTIKVKIVYYGPAVGGKTTNLQVLHQNAQAERRGEMVSVHSAQDRTILFDLLPLKAAGFRGFDLRLQLAAVPGQAMYAATRRLVLKGADSVVFVANSAADRWDENVQSFREMADNLIAHQLDPASLPLVLQFNKRDLPEVTPIDFMERALNARKVPAIPAVALRGEGVLETFSSVLSATMEDLAVRYQVVDLGRGQPLMKWVKQALIDMFGATTLVPPSSPEAMEETRSAVFFPASSPELAPQDRRSLRIDLPEDALRMAAFGPNARANESLVDSYADVTSKMATEMAEMREQRERLRHWLDRMQEMTAAAHDLMAGQPREPILRLALEPLAEAAGSRFATMLAPGGEGPSIIAIRGLSEDPLLRMRTGRRVLERLLQEAEPRLHHGADSLDLGEALQESSPAFASVAAVPVRSASGPQALGLLYFTADDVLPGPPEIQQLRGLTGLLAPALELSIQQERARGDERGGELALLGLAAQRALEDLLASLTNLRDGVATARRDRSLTTTALAALGQLTPSLAEALGTTRALLALARGEAVEGEVAEVADVLAELEWAVEVLGQPEPVAVRADPVLLRLALASLADHLRGEDPRAEVQLRVSAAAGVVKLKLAPAVPESVKAVPDSDLRLQLVRRIVRQQGGSLAQEAEDGRTWTVLTLDPA
jgi:signal recognition particle receptor subunit beta